MPDTNHRYPLRSRGRVPNLAIEETTLETVVEPRIEINLGDFENFEHSSEEQDIDDLNNSESENEADAMAAINYQMDPYDGDINPGTTEGAKLFSKATQARSELLTLTQEKAKEILSAFEDDAREFGWGTMVHKVQVVADLDNDLKRSIFKDYRSVKLFHVKKAAERRWGNATSPFEDPVPTTLAINTIAPSTVPEDRPVFFARIKATMIAARILKSITEASKKSLMNKKKDFLWTDPVTGKESLDGPTMLSIILHDINPDTRVGVYDLKKDIMDARLTKFSNNVKDMLDHMDSQYQQIIQQGHTHEDYVMNLFDALLSSKNEEFRQAIRSEKTNWEKGEDVSADAIITVATAKYNNLRKQKTWNQVDPKDAKIVALTTKVENLAKALATNSSANGRSGGSDQKGKDGKNENRFPPLAEWRKKKDGASKIVDGVTWYWCPKHKAEGKFDGLYVKHKPDNHDSWKDEQKKRRGKPNKKNGNGGSSDSSKTLTLSDKLKSALLTKMSSEELEKMFSEN